MYIKETASIQNHNSGLDSFQADKVVDALAALAHTQRALVLEALHAPRSAAFARDDDLLLLVRVLNHVFLIQIQDKRALPPCCC